MAISHRDLVRQSALHFLRLVVMFGPMLTAGSAHAEFITQLRVAIATADFEWQASPEGIVVEGNQRDDIDQPPEFSAFAEVQLDPFSPLGRAAAFQDLYGINAVFADAENALEDAVMFSAFARTQYTINVRTRFRMPDDPTFKFVINGGELRIENFAEFQPNLPGGGDGAAVAASILKDPVAIGSLRFA